MEYLLTDLGWRRAGMRVSICLSAVANVRLVDAASAVFHQYGFPYIYVGGLALHSPYKLVVPEDDHWLVIVDLHGLVGAVSASVRVENPGVLRRAVKTLAA